MRQKISYLVLGLIVIIGLYYFYGYYRQHYIPSSVRGLADQLAINLVGDNYFRQNFTFSESSSFVSRSPGYDTSYQVAYHFKPLLQYTKNDLVFIFMKDNTFDYSIGIPNCVADKTNCTFAITKEDALTIARKNGFNASDLRVGWTIENRLSLEITSCSLNKHMVINYTNGSILKFEPYAVCGGQY